MPRTTRIPLIGDDTDDAKLLELFDRARGGFGGQVPNLYRTLGHAPELLEGWVSFAWSLRHDAAAPRALRELVILRVADELGCGYERTHHEPMALAAGCSDEQLAGLEGWRSAPELFSEPERAALAVAERIARGEPLTDDEWKALRTHLDARGCVEVVLTASFYVCVARVLDGLGVPLEDGDARTAPGGAAR